MAGKLTIWGTTPAEGVRDALVDAGIESGFVDYHSGSKPPIMDGGTLLILGSSTVEELARQGVVAKNRTVTSLRSDTHQWNNNKVRVSYSPAMKSLNSAFYTDFLTDLVLAVRLAVTGSIDPELGKYKYVDSFSDYCNQLHELSKDKIVPIVFDTETIGLDYLHLGDSTRPAARLVSLQLTIKAGEAHVVYFGSMAEQTEWFTKYRSQMEYLLNSPRLSMGGANFTYDLKWLRHFTGIISTNFKFDTTLVGSLLDENRSNSLSTHTKLYVPSLGGYSDAFDSRTDKSRMDLVNKKDLLEYGGGDTDACYQVRQRMTQELKKDPKLATFYIKVLHPAQRAFGEAEFNGVHVDMDRYAVLETDLNKVLNEATRKAAEAVGGRILAKHKDESKMGGINITKASLIKDFMFSPMGLNLKPRMTTAKSGAPSTAREHIEMFSDIPEAKAFVDAFKEYGSAAKMLSTYVTGFQKHLRSDGRFHPSYFLFMGDKQAGEGGTKCMPRGELVLTNKGYLPIEDVTTAHKVLSHTGEARRVLAQINNGKKPVLQVTLQNGCELNTTGNHPYLVDSGKWVNAEDLQVGDKVVVHSAAEEWRVVAEFPNYKVSSWGRVKNHTTNNILTQFEKGQWGHLQVTLTRNGAQDRRAGDKRDVPVHRLVAEYFEVSGVGEEVRHLNGIAWDNTVSNLQYGSSKDNSQDAMLHGTTTKRKGVQAKLTEEVVLKLRGTEAYLSSRGAGLKYGVSPSLVRRVRRGERWEPRALSPSLVAFSLSEVTAIVSVGLYQTYGVEVEIDHSHVTQGIVTHNTGRLSARNPAFQCLKGSSLIITAQGELAIEDIVNRFEAGEDFAVLTHTGKWRRLTDTYRNGIKKVFSVSLESGRTLDATANHPFLTQRGWVKVGDLEIGDTCYELRTSYKELYKPDLPQLGSHEEPLSVEYKQGLPSLRRGGNNSLSGVAEVRELSQGHGGETCSGMVDRPNRQLQGVRAEQLPLGNSGTAASQPQSIQDDNLSWSNSDRGGLGNRVWNQSGQTSLPIEARYDDGSSLDEGDPWDRTIFKPSKVISIEYSSTEETFDLTIESSHSFVANGIVVHNTLPKHSYWGKRIRSCFTAPEGFLVTEKDYSQGELKVVACMADERNMIKAYREGKDLHVLTAALVNDMTYDHLLGLKATDYDLYDSLRSNGKAGNFGLLYGMSAAGFQAYAATVYGVHMTLQDAEDFRTAYLYKSYPALPDYHEVYKEMARNKGYITSPLGRKRHLPLARSRNQESRSSAERQAINSGVQSTLSDMLCWAMAISHERGHTQHAPCFGAIHDATYNYVPEDDWEKWVKKDLEIMENLPLDQVGWKPQLNFTADAKIGKSMGELEDCTFT